MTTVGTKSGSAMTAATTVRTGEERPLRVTVYAPANPNPVPKTAANAPNPRLVSMLLTKRRSANTSPYHRSETPSSGIVGCALGEKDRYATAMTGP